MAKIDKDFHKFESKIDEVMKILQLMNSSDAEKQKNGTMEAKKLLGQDSDSIKPLPKDEFIVKIKEDRSVINTSKDESQMSQKNFMDSVERDAVRRTRERNEREAIAQNLRRLGNDAFRNKEYEKAISMYSKAIDHIKDSPVLYNNRALSYIKLNLYKKAIIDADFVIQKLDEKNVRAWLYRANGYLLLGETRSFEKSINEAKKNNPKELDFIEKSVAQIIEDNNLKH